MPGESVRCVVADDHPAMVEAVVAVLERHDVVVVARARDGEAAISAIEEHEPHVALVDLRMPHVDGIDVARRVSRSGSRTGIVLYTAYGERSTLLEALDAGARGFVLKEAPLGDLARAVVTVAEGGTYVDPVLVGVLASSEAIGKLPALSKREREVLRLLADGHTNEEIGKRLFISPETVRTYVRNAMGKLEAETRTQAVATALRQSLIA